MSAPLFLLPLAGATVAGWTRDVWVPSCTGFDGLLGFVAVTAPLCAASLLPTYAIAVGAGYVYGSWLGPFVALGALVLGAWLGLCMSPRLVTRHLLTDCGPRAQEIGAAIRASSRWMTAVVIGLIRLAPVTPFAWTNALMAGTRVAVLPYLAGTLVGLAPRTALVAVAGASMAELDWGGGTARADPWVTLGLLASALVGLALVGSRLRGRIGPQACPVHRRGPDLP
ncbi:MAG: TVP38/TMEM64 family protein [Planctomycetota bacterium]